MTNTNSFTLVFIQNARRQETALAKAKRLPDFVLDETHEPIQVEEAMFIVRGRKTGSLKHRDVFSSCPENEMTAFLGEMARSASQSI
ncbi:MAG: hypothetical protein IPP57_08710 [Candidatus Obscuribacter sp.]|jgi:hypothetical protein|nr:hypothetical protein [Candidatus Obscuribacter sp.]MBK7840130.1 hypothetical protein [Candidatus Obscuribacter sp.]MBK9770888.1 hypothetical protein [Candidatus Obscuribacter sp.]MBL0186433.1 hypothetical protein [Candidatus Obscuribacter sp.]